MNPSPEARAAGAGGWPDRITSPVIALMFIMGFAKSLFRHYFYDIQVDHARRTSEAATGRTPSLDMYFGTTRQKSRDSFRAALALEQSLA